MNMLAKSICGLVVSFVVTGGRTWSFHTLNLEVFNQLSMVYTNLRNVPSALYANLRTGRR